MSDKPLILQDSELDAHLKGIDIISILEQTFAALKEGKVVQPPQTLTLFPDNRGDFITYLGVLSHFDVFGAKLSPYIPTEGKPVITAWTVLMSMVTGQPLLLCDSGRLTTERTAAATAVAVKKLAREESDILAVVGSGAIARAHIRHALAIRPWKEIRVFSPSLHGDPSRQAAVKSLDKRIAIGTSARETIRMADVVMLATSSGTPVIDTSDIGKNALITSISTNVVRAHEIDPAQLSHMDVYCDYKNTTPDSAGEMVMAAEAGTWSRNNIAGDLADLCANACHLPNWDRPVFFRSIGLGLEDIAIAYAIYKNING